MDIIKNIENMINDSINDEESAVICSFDVSLDIESEIYFLASIRDRIDRVTKANSKDSEYILYYERLYYIQCAAIIRLLLDMGLIDCPQTALDIDFVNKNIKFLRF